MADAKTLREWHEFLSRAKEFSEDTGSKFRIDVEVHREKEKVTITKYYVREEIRDESNINS